MCVAAYQPYLKVAVTQSSFTCYWRHSLRHNHVSEKNANNNFFDMKVTAKPRNMWHVEWTYICKWIRHTYTRAKLYFAHTNMHICTYMRYACYFSGGYAPTNRVDLHKHVLFFSFSSRSAFYPVNHKKCSTQNPHSSVNL